MEEKERYEIHIYDDICVDLYDNGVLDKSINDTYKLEKLLNQQDKENQQLKQQLHELPKNIVEEIKIEMSGIEDILINYGNGKEDTFCWINEILNTILRKYGGENE